MKLWNTIAIGIPILLGLFSIFFNPLIILACYSTIITGFIQVVIATIKLYFSKNKIYYAVYYVLVISFFLLWYYNVKINYNDALTWPLIFSPLLLCIYLSILIYKEI